MLLNNLIREKAGPHQYTDSKGFTNSLISR